MKLLVELKRDFDMNSLQFQIIESRFHAIEKDKYIVVGIIRGNDKSKKIQVQARLDNRKVPSEIHAYEGADVARKYMYEEDEITKEWHICITLPHDYQKYKKLQVTICNGSFYEKLAPLIIKDLVERKKRQYHIIANCEFVDEQCTVFGECALQQPIHISLQDGKNNDIPMQVSWQPRAESRCYYPEYGYLLFSDYVLRFNINDIQTDNVRIQIQSGTSTLIESISITEKRKAWNCQRKAEQGMLHKMRYYCYRMTHSMTQYSATEWMHKVKIHIQNHRIQNQSEIEQYNDWLKKRLPSQEKLVKQSECLFNIQPLFGVERKIQFQEQSYKNWKIGFEDCDYIVHVPEDASVSPDALYECVKLLNREPDVDLIYADEDQKIKLNQYQKPNFKPDFNPDLLRSMNYIGAACVIRKSLYQDIATSIDSDIGTKKFYLECMKRQTVFAHIPRILFHMPCNMEEEQEIQHVKYDWDEQPLISILIPNKDHIEELDTCIRSIEEKSGYRNYEFIIIENNSVEADTFAYYKKIEAENSKVRVLHYEGEFNYSKINNWGAKYANGDYILLLNNDTELIAPGSLWELLSHAMRPEVGIVGARLYFPDDTIQHAGVIVGYGGVAGHAFLGFDKDNPGYQNRIQCIQDYSAVTAACMMIPKEVFNEVEGLSEEYQVAFNDIDFCLRVRKLGYLVVYNPYAEFYHYESKSRGCEDTTEKMVRYQQEVQRFTSQWKQILLEGDPYYNVNLSLEKKDFSLRE